MDNQTEVSIKFKNYVDGEKKLERYAETLAKIQSVTKGIDNGTIKSLEDASKNTQNIANEVKELNKTTKTAFTYSQIREFSRALQRTFKEMSRLTTKSADYLENVNLFRVAFDGNYESAEKFINKMSEMYGLDESWLTRTVGIFKQLSNAMNLSAEQGTKLSTLLTQMSIDISSLYNIDVEKASTTLQSALAGQTKPIRGATGGDITQATLQQTLGELGIDRYIADLSYAEKRLLIIISLTRQLSQATNDFGKTIESPANQTRILKEQWERLSRALGNVFLPILAKILPYLNAILMVFTELISLLAKFISKTLNFNPEDTIGEVADGVIDLGENFDSATESAKKLKQGLRGFDKLNVITTPTTTSASSGTGGIDPKIMDAFNNAFDEYNTKLKEVEMTASKIYKSIMNWLGFTKDANGEWQWSADLLKNNILKTLKDIWEWLKKNWKTILAISLIIGSISIMASLKDSDKGLGKTTKATNNLTKAVKSLGSAFKILSVGVTGFLILQSIAKVMEEFNEILKTMKDAGMDFKDIGSILGVILLEIAGGFTALALATKLMDWTGIIGAVVILGGLALVLGQINDLFTTLSEQGMTLGEVAGTLGAVLGIVVASMVAMAGVSILLSSNPLALLGVLALVGSISAILLVMKATLPTILDACGKFIEKIAPFLIDLLRTIGDVISDIIYSLGKVLPPIIEAVGRNFEIIFSGVERIIRAVGDVLIGILKTLESLIKTVLTGIVKFINEVGPAINNFVDNVIVAITKLVNFIVSAFEYAINTTIIASINGLIKAYNGSLGDFFAWLGFEAHISEVKKVKIERFNPQLYADGGLPPVGQLFVANENGPELVGQIGGQSFVANQNQMMDLLDKKIGDAQSNQNTTFNIYVGDEEVASVVLDKLDNIAKTNGKPITIGG